jgi:SAM-dependent methyltransferase
MPQPALSDSPVRIPPKCTCSVCGTQAATPLLQVEAMPAHHVRPCDRTDTPGDYGALEIVACTVCGHLFNAAFAVGAAAGLYETHAPTNAPVSPGMLAAVKDIADFIFAERAKVAGVLEIGCGVGALARLMAERAASVDLIEPSLAVSTASFGDERIRLLPGFFPAASRGQIYDLIVCRQVLEHIDSPVEFLAAIRAHLAPDGEAYIEVPSADYIVDNASLVDFHYMHVQYFTTRIFEQLLAQAGFVVRRSWKLKGGHDMGYVLGLVTPSVAAWSGKPSLDSLVERLRARRRAGEIRLRSLQGGTAFYGACAYLQALLGHYPNLPVPAAIFDDTPGYRHHEVYCSAWRKPVLLPSAELLAPISNIVIASYLHDRAIAERLAKLGYTGSIFTMRCDEDAGRAAPDCLFVAV